MFDKINRMKPWQVACIFAVVGLAVFFTGLNNPFQNDDFYQIVNNTPVHSIGNLPQFFGSSTFFNGEKLTGVYYRPLMTTTFSLIYSIFGAQPIAYHIVQLILYTSGAFVLYLVFKHFFKPTVSLILALIFLVHPLNSQVVFSIPTMQDALFFLFGISAIWILINYKSNRGLWAAVACLLAAMFSKESGILFTVVAFLYLFWFDRSRVLALLKAITLPIVLYFILKINAVGIIGAHHAAPINDLDFIGRLFTAPSIFLFYIAKFIFPQQLSLGYYWTHPTFNISDVLIPLIVDLLIIGLFVYFGFRVKVKLSKEKFRIYLFFAAWTVIGLGLYMQIIPGLDFTACETWFYFAMAGLLGMIGTVLMTIKINLRPEWLVIPAIVLIALLGVRSGLRGLDYSSQYNLAVHDLTVSDDNFAAMNNIAQHLIDQGKYKEAESYARRSIGVYPIISNYINLGVVLQQTGDYSGSIEAYEQALKYGNTSIIYENLALTHIVYSNPPTTAQFFQKALQEYPHNFKLWLYYAVFEGALGSNDKAKNAIVTATTYGDVPRVIYDGIIKRQPFNIPILGKKLLIR